MLESILLINLTFSIVGFFFILRMWREVKSRRDFYGENFAIPKGKDKTKQAQNPVPPQAYQQPQVDMAQVAALVNAMQQTQGEQLPSVQPSQQVTFPMNQGDYNKMMAAIQQQGGGV